MAEEFKVITTQEELDNVIRDRIRRAKDAEAAKYADYSSIKEELENGRKTLNEYKENLGKTQKAYEDELAKNKTLTAENLRTIAAIEAGLPVSMRDRLKGEDADALKKDAEELSKALNAGKPVPPLRKSDSETFAEQEKNKAYEGLLKGLTRKEN